MSEEMKDIFRERIDNSNWRVYIDKLMLNWNDHRVKDDTEVKLPAVGSIDVEIHKQIPMSYSLPVCVCVLSRNKHSEKSWNSSSRYL